ncbi:MAG TPA: flagellar basal-body MS-ring/collar protein FliF, partial [Vulgatibacter sp.]|nr:flagellar basal-body MS-ring/collar protein FliF [Vulgatibacter sp.]
METLLKQLRELPSRLLALPTFARRSLFGGVAALLVLAVGITWILRSGDGYQYAFTNLSADDGSEAAGHLSAVGIPFRLEANGTALAVPSEHLHEARLLLASAGLPKGGGVGFELFDRGDIGVSEFTQRVNLRRAIEGELARTIGSLAEVRSARVHVTLEDKGLYRDNDRAAAASVVLNLHPGRVLGDRELAGIRHLVAAAVPGLRAEGVTIVDGKGSVLGPGDSYGSAFAAVQRDIERDLERRIISILEPAVGPGAAVARVTATLETTESSTSSEIYDPDRAAVRTERRMSQSQESDRSLAAGVAGAAANQ